MAKAIEYVEIRIDDRSGGQRTTINTSAPGHPLTDLRFSLRRNEGCDQCAFTVVRDGRTSTIQNRDSCEVWVKTKAAAIKRYWKGVIVSTPWEHTSKRVVRFEAEGLWRELTQQRVVKFYEGEDVDDMVKSLLAVADNDSLISSATTGVSIGSPETIADFEAEYITYADAFETLAKVQGDVQYGVDQDGVLYFEDVTTAKGIVFFEGKNVHDLDGRVTSDKLVNRVYMQSKQMVAGANLTLTRSDATRITNEGLAEAVVQVPHLEDADNVWLVGADELVRGEEQVVVSAKPTGVTQFLFPRGEARVWLAGGTAVDLPIQFVTYKLSGDLDFIGEVGLGNAPALDMREELRRMRRDIETARSSRISLTRIEHTRGVEWMQDAIVDAMKQGNLNHYLNPLEQTRGLDQDLSVHMKHDQLRSLLTNDPNMSGGVEALIFSPIVPCGQVVDTIRCHLDFDLEGRINFNYEEDLTEFFTENGGSTFSQWTITPTRPTLTQIGTGANTLEFKYPTGYTHPVGYDARVAFKNVVDNSGFTLTSWYMYFNYVDTNNWQRLTFTGGDPTGSQISIFWQKRVAGTISTVVAKTAFILEDLIIRLQVRNTPSATNIRVYDYDMVESVASPLTGTIASVTNGGFEWHNMGITSGATEVSAEIDFFAPGMPNPGASDRVDVSRDGGTTFNGTALVQGIKDFNISVAGQPSDTDLLCKLKVKYPTLIYGLGFSF